MQKIYQIKGGMQSCGKMGNRQQQDNYEGKLWIECQVWLSSWVLALGVSPCACEEEIISLRVGGQSSKMTARGCSLETIAGNEVAVQLLEKKDI